MESPTENLIKLQGQLESITYENKENDYLVAKVRVRGYEEPVTIVGNIPSPIPGEILYMSGEWYTHPKFGEQFKVIFCSCFVPSSELGIEKYLGSGLIKGIGPVMAKRIVQVFGVKTLDVIEKSIEKLLQIEGMGYHRIEMIRATWAEQKEIRSVMVLLQSNGVSSAYASKIYRKYGNRSIEIIRRNPYQLLHDISGIGFFTADQIAQKLGFDEKSPLRAAAGIMYLLCKSVEEGNIYCDLEELIPKAKNMLNVDEEILEIALKSLLAEDEVVIESLENNHSIVYGIFLSGYHLAETQTAQMLKTIRDSTKNTQELCANRSLKYAQKKLSIALAEKQIEAVQAALTNKLLVITGGPGTGKTTIIKAIFEIFSSITDKILLAAPTGRAAKRLAETIGESASPKENHPHEKQTFCKAKTIHRLLEFDPVSYSFKLNENNQLECDLIILDEASMIDAMLMHHLLKAIPARTTLILVGDINQLPSVGAGTVLKDIISSQAFKVVELNEIFRQEQQSSIILNAHKIISGQCPEIDNNENSDFYFLPEDDQSKVLEKILLLVKERISQKFGYDPLNDIQVLTPMNRGIVGTIKINEALQDTLNPDGFELTYGGRRYRIGDKVMQTRNNYSKNVFNGDIGFISDIDPENLTLTVDIDGNSIVYEYADLDELTLAYAVSIHKSQGSEYSVVVMPLVMAHYIMLQRNLLYTGITRGKKLVIVVGSKKALHIAVSNNKITTRNTWLRERLKS
ncbi:MAG: ATP-dependent RecD-like DNA helicase [Holosporaceae bacterium]|jgi:exodeoxyribonuclease V alpha subunit|nr:ATP-dependent RecD-like DNA helicase [Holosporaceae bacterium]